MNTQRIIAAIAVIASLTACTDTTGTEAGTSNGRPVWDRRSNEPAFVVPDTTPTLRPQELAETFPADPVGAPRLGKLTLPDGQTITLREAPTPETGRYARVTSDAVSIHMRGPDVAPSGIACRSEPGDPCRILRNQVDVGDVFVVDTPTSQWGWRVYDVWRDVPAQDVHLPVTDLMVYTYLPGDRRTFILAAPVGTAPTTIVAPTTTTTTTVAPTTTTTTAPAPTTTVAPTTPTTTAPTTIIVAAMSIDAYAAGYQQLIQSANAAAPATPPLTDRAGWADWCRDNVRVLRQVADWLETTPLPAELDPTLVDDHIAATRAAHNHLDTTAGCSTPDQGIFDIAYDAGTRLRLALGLPTRR